MDGGWRNEILKGCCIVKREEVRAMANDLIVCSKRMACRDRIRNEVYDVECESIISLCRVSPHKQ